MSTLREEVFESMDALVENTSVLEAHRDPDEIAREMLEMTAFTTVPSSVFDEENLYEEKVAEIAGYVNEWQEAH